MSLLKHLLVTKVSRSKSKSFMRSENAFRVVAVIVNGGLITRKEALFASRIKIPLVFIQGSGRFADEVLFSFSRAFVSHTPSLRSSSMKRTTA
jgi:hypothetical protein